MKPGPFSDPKAAAPEPSSELPAILLRKRLTVHVPATSAPDDAFHVQTTFQFQIPGRRQRFPDQRNVRHDAFVSIIIAVMFRFSLLLSVFVGFACIGKAAPDTNHHVILITIDGGAAYYFNDPKAKLHNLRQLATDGVVARGMKVSNPAVTWPNHTTLITGVTPAKHSVLFNGLAVRNAKGGFNVIGDKTQAELIAVPTIYDFLHGKGFKTANVNWPCTPGSTTLDFNLPDLDNQLRRTSPEFVAELRDAKILDETSAAAFDDKTGPKRDRIWADTACYLMQRHRPNLMLLHFLVADSRQHVFGPKTPEAYEVLGLIDQHIGKLLATLDESGLRERTSILIAADHGFVRIDKQIVAPAILRKAGLLETAPGKQRVQMITAGGSALIYLHSTSTKEEDRKKVMELFKRQEGVDRIIEPKDYAAYGYPSPEKNPHMADLVLSAREGYKFAGLDMVQETIIPTRNGGAGTHGYLSTNPKMNAMFIASGRGIAKGKTIGIVHNIDVAPTIAHLLGEKFPNADGKVMEQILAE